MQYIDETKAVKLYDDFIDEITPQIQILGMGYFPSTVLKNVTKWLIGASL